MSRTYTAVHWLGAQATVEYFMAHTDSAALRAFEEMDSNAYDDRKLLSGRIEPVDCVPAGYSHEVTDSTLAGDGTHTSTSYGVMPDRELFERAFDARCPDGRFSFGNDPYVGTDTLTCSQLWCELQAQFATWEQGEHAAHCPGDGECRGDGCPSEDAGSWCSCVLGILGFEWI